MTIQHLIDSKLFDIENIGNDTSAHISAVFCCDLPSLAMNRAPSGCAWITVIGSSNILAVADLRNCACIILAEGTRLNEIALSRAREHGLTVFRTELPVFDAALTVYKHIKNGMSAK